MACHCWQRPKSSVPIHERQTISSNLNMDLLSGLPEDLEAFAEVGKLHPGASAFQPPSNVQAAVPFINILRPTT